MTYSPGEDAASSFASALARSTSGADSIQRRLPSLCTLKMWKGGNKAHSSLQYCGFNHMPDSVSVVEIRASIALCQNNFAAMHCVSKQGKILTSCRAPITGTGGNLEFKFSVFAVSLSPLAETRRRPTAPRKPRGARPPVTPELGERA